MCDRTVAERDGAELFDIFLFTKLWREKKVVISWKRGNEATRQHVLLIGLNSDLCRRQHRHYHHRFWNIVHFFPLGFMDET